MTIVSLDEGPFYIYLRDISFRMFPFILTQKLSKFVSSLDEKLFS